MFQNLAEGQIIPIKYWILITSWDVYSYSNAMGKYLWFLLEKKITGTSDNTGLLPMFTIERNAKFHFEFTEDKDVILFPI